MAAGYSEIPGIDHHHPDVPQPIVDQVLDQLDRQSPDEMPLIQAQWQRLAVQPHLRDYVTKSALELAPNDLHHRGEVVRSLLGLLAIEDEAALSDRLEQLMEEPAVASFSQQLELEYSPVTRFVA